jgi:protein-disulfide isomerase
MVVMAKNKEESSRLGLFERLAPVLLIITIGLAFMVGVLWQKVANLESGGVTATTTKTDTTAAAPAAAKVDIATIKGLFSKDIIKFGDANRKLLFVEVVDPSCPYCHVAGGDDPELATEVGTQFKYKSSGGDYVPPVPEMKKLIDSGEASLAIIYYPGHANGEMAMKALYCANEKGKFWEAHALLMNRAGYDLQNTTVKNDKTQSGAVADFLKGAVDSAFMKSCLDSGKYDSRLADEQALAGTLSIQGTPGFYINETSFPGAYSWTDMKPTADAALK